MSVTEAELDLIRAEQEKFLDKKLTVKRDEFLGGSEGDFASDPVFARGVPCSIKEGFGFYRPVADRFQVTNPHIISFAWDQDIKAGDKLITEEGPEATFEVRDVPNVKSYNTLLRVLADRLV